MLVNLVPTMTSSTAPYGTVSVSAFVSGYGGYYAFDGSSSTAWGVSSGSLPEYISYTLAKSRAANQYVITCPGATYGPKTFSFQGFDGTTWVTLDTQTNVTDWVNGVAKTYTFTNETSYSKYRLYITAANGSPIRISNLDFNYVPSKIYLFQDGSSYKTVTYSGITPSLSTVGSVSALTLNESLFNTNGFAYLEDLTYSVMSGLSSNYTVLTYCTNTTTSLSAALYGTPLDGLMVQTQDLSLDGRLETLTINATLNGNGGIKVAVSSDGGSTWQVYDGTTSTWSALSELTAASLWTNGMTHSSVSSIPQTAWATLGQVYRLAYVFHTPAFMDVAWLNSLTAMISRATTTPQIANLAVSYQQVDPLYYGLLFTDLSGNVYTKADGTIVSYLDLGNILAGNSSLNVAVKVKNGYNFSVNNIVITEGTAPDGATLDLSYSNAPFAAQTSLTFTDTLAPDDTITLYVRLNALRGATTGGIFKLSAKASVVS